MWYEQTKKHLAQVLIQKPSLRKKNAKINVQIKTLYSLQLELWKQLN